MVVGLLLLLLSISICQTAAARCLALLCSALVTVNSQGQVHRRLFSTVWSVLVRGQAMDMGRGRGSIHRGVNIPAPSKSTSLFGARVRLSCKKELRRTTELELLASQSVRSMYVQSVLFRIGLGGWA